MNSPNQQKTAHHPQQEQQAIALIKAGRLQKAEIIYQNLIREGSSNPIVFGNLAAICLARGKPKESIPLLEKAIKINPNYPQAYVSLGNIFKDQGDYNAAIQFYKKALSIKSNFPEAYNNLGNALKGNRQLNAAIEAHKKALRLKPDFPQALNDLGFALRKDGQLKEAINAYKKALKLKPNFAQAHHNLGIALKDNEQPTAAIDAYRQAVKFKPNFPQAYNNLGIVLKGEGQLTAAINAYKQALKLKPNFLQAYNNLGFAQREKGDLEAARINHQRALAIDPKNASAFYGLGRIQRSQGELKQAKQTLKKSLQLDPFNTASLHILSTDIESTDEATEIIEICRHCKTKKLSIRENATVEFALANCFHKLHNYDIAAHHLAQANSLKLSYLPSNLETRLRQTKQFSEEAEHIQPGEQNDGFNRIFIVGVPRCGSTLLETILASNPNIKELGESDAMPKAVKRINPSQSNPLSGNLSDAYSKELHEDPNHHGITVDKNLYNYQRIQLIARAMPAAKIIHCRRNPMDNILSMLRSNLRSGNNFTSDILDAAKFISNQDQIMEQAKSSYGAQIFTFNYDEFTNNPETTIKPLITWLGLEWDQNYLYPEKTKRVIRTASAIQARQPINNKSVQGWKNYQDLLQPAEFYFRSIGHQCFQT